MTTAITTTWNIAQLERRCEDGMIQTVHWTVDATDGNYRAGAYGSIGLEPADPEAMVPFADLTPELVVQWVKDHFGEEKVAEVEQALADQIEQQRAPKTAQGLPWAAAA